MADLFGIFERVAARIVTAPATTRAPRVYPPIAAFENYIKGLLAATPATSLSYLERVARRPANVRSGAAGDLGGLRRAGRSRSRARLWSRQILQTSESYRRARFLVGLSQLNLGRNDDAFQTFRLLSDT